MAGEETQKFLGDIVDPVQVFEHQHQRLIAALAKQQAHDRLLGAAAAGLGVHLRERIGAFIDAKQRKKVGQRLFETPIEQSNLAGHLLTPGARFIVGRDFEVIMEQLDQRQIRRRLAMGE